MDYFDFDFDDCCTWPRADYNGCGCGCFNQCCCNNSDLMPWCYDGFFNPCSCGNQCTKSTSYMLPAGVCCQTINNVVVDGSINSRIIVVPVTIKNLAYNNEFIVWATVYENTAGGPVVVGQDYKVVCNSGLPGCGDYTFEMTIAVNIPICDNADISVSVDGNYVNICDGINTL